MPAIIASSLTGLVILVGAFMQGNNLVVALLAASCALAFLTHIEGLHIIIRQVAWFVGVGLGLLCIILLFLNR